MGHDVVQSFTAIMVAIIAAGGTVWATYLASRVRQVRDKVNGNITALIESNQKLAELVGRELNDDGTEEAESA